MSIGRLRRNLDLDAIERLKLGIKHEPKAMKRVHDPRPAASYRAAKRNALRERRRLELMERRAKRGTAPELEAAA